MNRLTASVLALALAVGAGTASAQVYVDPGYSGRHVQPYPDRYGHNDQSRYDYARVLRVDPVLDGYRKRYGRHDRDRHDRDRYDRNRYDHRNRYTRVGDGRRCYQRSDYYANGYYPERGYYGRDDDYGRYGGRGYGNENGRTIATVIGGVLGAVVGSQVGGGSARYATSAIGTMVGGIAGREVYDYNHRRTDRGTVTVCDPVFSDRYGDNYYATNRHPAVTAYDVTYEYAGRTYTTRTDYHPGDRIRVRVDVVPVN